MDLHFDVVIVGSGIAGLSYALNVAGYGYSVGILTKKDKAESNTNYAQGGIACVTDLEDNFELHVQDTLKAGDGLCDEEVVRTIVREGPQRIGELVEWGVNFSRKSDGSVDLGREGGHCKRRILHVKDLTGKAIEEALLHAVAENKNIQLFEHYFAIDCVTASKIQGKHESQEKSEVQDHVVGLYALDVHSGKVIAVHAKVVMIASGGVGQVYLYTTNPGIATGDGVAMGYRAGVEIENMEFVQFHPTSLYSQGQKRFLISEAVRGEGAVLVNEDGEEFMKRYDSQGDLASRDIVARAIDSEMKRSGAEYVWLMFRNATEEKLRQRFPNIYEHCLKLGLRMERDRIPVVPAAHYLCGGIRTDLEGRTNIRGLYAVGEVACTGLHGANRLASNSLLEAVVMSHRAAASTVSYLSEEKGAKLSKIPAWVSGQAANPDERVVIAHNWDEIRRLMWDYVGIVRTTKRLERARARIQFLAKEIHDYYWNFKVEPKLLELRNLVVVADLMVRSALHRHESRGLHYTLDYPKKKEPPKNTVVIKSVDVPKSRGHA
jgi:L-aspartate oxidase